MQRTQIYFPKSLHQDLKTGAAMMNKTLSEFIRMVLEEKLYSRPIKAVKKKVRLSVIAKNAISFGKKDIARNFSKYFEESLK